MNLKPANATCCYFTLAAAKACKNNLTSAILFEHFSYWTKLYAKKEDRDHYWDSCYWRQDSVRQLEIKYPFLSRGAIHSSLLGLVKANLLHFSLRCTRKFNKVPMQVPYAYSAVLLKGSNNQKIHFQTQDAIRYGLRNSIVLNYIAKSKKSIGIPLLVKKLPMSESQIRRSTAELEKTGVIEGSKDDYLVDMIGRQTAQIRYQLNRSVDHNTQDDPLEQKFQDSELCEAAL